MKCLINYHTIFGMFMLIILTPAIAMADPAGPGGDPYATPVNGGVAAVAALAFLFGVYRMYQIAKKNRAGNTDL